MLVGCLLNRAAVAAAARSAAEENGTGVTVVCAGNDYGATFSLDDSMTAGAIVASVRESLEQGQPNGGAELTDAAVAAERLFQSYQPELVQAFLDGSHGRVLQRIGFSDDLLFCATLDRSAAVPVLAEEAGNLLVLRLRP